MPKSQYKSNGELKFLARMQTSHYMGLLVGTVLLNFIISYAAVSIISSIIPTSTTVGYILNYFLVFAVQVVTSVLDVGVAFIFLKSACNMQSTISDLFYGFKKNMSKAIIIGLILMAIKSICLIPYDIATIQLSNVLADNPIFNEYDLGSLGLMMGGSSSSIDGYEFLQAYTEFYNAMIRYSLIMLVCTVVSFVLTLPFFPAYYMILDFPDQSTTAILKKCFEVMHGNMLRLFLMYLSFVPLLLLSMFTCGIALIWVIPYMKMTATNFYLDMMAVRNKNMK
jgi:uncharacterized membrane protein